MTTASTTSDTAYGPDDVARAAAYLKRRGRHDAAELLLDGPERGRIEWTRGPAGVSIERGLVRDVAGVALAMEVQMRDGVIR